MSNAATIPPRTGTITVDVPVERAFRTFTDAFGSWWPAEYHIGQTDHGHSHPGTTRRRALPRPWGVAAGWPVGHVLSCAQGSDDSALREASHPVV
jgi:hypothetical protein